MPRWLSALLGGLPGLFGAGTFLTMSITDHRQFLDLSARDSFLVAGVVSILVATVVSLSILCIVLLRAR